MPNARTIWMNSLFAGTVLTLLIDFGQRHELQIRWLKSDHHPTLTTVQSPHRARAITKPELAIDRRRRAPRII